MSYKKQWRMIFKPYCEAYLCFDYETDKDTAVTSYKGNKVNREDYPDAVMGIKHLFNSKRFIKI
jgi:hypothetical protein